MRILWMALIPVLLGTGQLHAQQQRAKRAGQQGTLWAVSYSNTSPGTMVLTPTPAVVAPPANAPANALPANNVPAPIANHAPLASPPLVAHGAPGGGPGCCPGGECGGCDHGCPCWDRFLAWLCFRPKPGCCKGYGCCYHCHPPLYVYFLGECREGICHGIHKPAPCPSGCCGWGKVFDTGHRMFAMPTGHGVGGIR